MKVQGVASSSEMGGISGEHEGQKGELSPLK